MIRLANAPCSWGVLEKTEGERSPYALVLDEMQETGYQGTELGDWGFMPTEPQHLKAELDARGLALMASFVSVRFYDPDYLEAGIEAAVRTAQLLAEVGGPGSLIVIGEYFDSDSLRHNKAGRIRPEHGLSQTDWERYTAAVTRMAQAVKRETGLRSVFHPHGATFVETPEEVETFLSLTDPGLIGLCLDTGHYALGGGDPAAGLKAHAHRIWHVHFKDFDPAVLARADEQGWGYLQMVGWGLFSELGRGSVDFPAVLAALQEAGYDGWIVVEQDVLPGMGTPRESAARNRAYLRSIGL